jgi:hypothetical protein
VGFGLWDELREAGIECHVLAPTKIKRSQKDRKAKTDAKDSQGKNSPRCGSRIWKRGTTGSWSGPGWIWERRCRAARPRFGAC